MASDQVSHVSESTFGDLVLASPVPVLVDFHAPWCGPCRTMSPVVDQLAEELRGTIRVCKVNVDESPALAAEYNIRSIPCLMVFREGDVVESIVGSTDKATVRALLGC